MPSGCPSNHFRITWCRKRSTQTFAHGEVGSYSFVFQRFFLFLRFLFQIFISSCINGQAFCQPLSFFSIFDWLVSDGTWLPFLTFSHDLVWEAVDTDLTAWRSWFFFIPISRPMYLYRQDTSDGEEKSKKLF